MARPSWEGLLDLHDDLPRCWEQMMSYPVSKPLLQALNGEKPCRYPVWFLRQAGRYLPEYQKVRASLSFLELCRNPQKAAEVTLQPLRRFDLDAAIIFSDILILPAHMGQSLHFDAGHGPILAPVVRGREDLKRLRLPDSEAELGFVGEAIALSREKLGKGQSLIGFAGAPFTVASYMVEGAGSKTYSEVKKLLYRDPATFCELLQLIATASLSYLQMQIRAGAEAIMLFDSWAGQLTADDYSQYVLPSLKALVEGLRREQVPLIYYPGQNCEHLYALGSLDVQALAIDWRIPLRRAGAIFAAYEGRPKAAQGNLDPMVLSWADRQTVQARVCQILKEAAGEPFSSHIFNVGHGLLPSTRIESIEWAIEAIRAF